MIVEGKPELGLQAHQQEAYEEVKKAYEEGNKASIVIPTGCGKSFIALQLMADNKEKRILYIAPTNAIRNQMYNYIAKYIVGEEPTKERTAIKIAEEYFSNLKIILYPNLLKINDELMEKINADIIIMDELHRTGADKWGKKIDTLLEKNPNAKILGLTATPDRMDDINVIDKLFEGKIDYELTLVEALRNRIVKSPTYVKCDYALSEHLGGIKSAIDKCTDEQTKKELQDKFNKMRKIVEQADKIPELFVKNIKNKDGKYIVFCKDKKHMDELMEKAKEWFKEVDSEPEMYSVYAGQEGYNTKENAKNIKKFENSKSEHIKLLFSIDMLNEGLHVEDISGVIMARPTDSRIIYLQQLGRALSSDTSKDVPIVFDLVNNYLQNNLDAELNKRTNKRNGNRDKNKIDTNIDGGYVDTDIEDISSFRIQGETQEFLKLLMETQEIISRSNYLTNAKATKAWIEKSGGTKPPSAASKNKEEKRLGKALETIRYKLIKPYMKLETEEEKENFRKNYPEIDEVLEIVKEIDKNNVPIYLKNAKEIEVWIERSSGTKPPSPTSKNEEEKRLGIALATIRFELIKPYMKLETEEEKENFRKNHPEIDEVLKIVEEIDKNNVSPYLINAREIVAWLKKTKKAKLPSAASKNKEEKRLGIALSNIRIRLIKPYMKLETEEEKENFRENHPEIDEILDIISKLDIQCGNKSKKELAILIQQDLRKRKVLQEAYDLEQQYEQQLLIK